MIPETAGRLASRPYAEGSAGVLACPVRGCGLDLEIADAKRAACARGHSFDRARAGYWNLLQPQDRRSLAAGDDRPTALARRRLAEAGHLDPWVQALRQATAGLAPGATLLDVGCGEGSLLAAVVYGRDLVVHGSDLSTLSIELAARAYPQATWAVANADRRLPYRDAAFDLVLVVTGPLPAAELRRVLRPGGGLLVAVPGADDLVELREAVLGRGELRERLGGALDRLAGALEVESRWTIRWQTQLDRAGIADALASGYRAARGRAARAAELEGLEVTMSRDLALLRPLPPACGDPAVPVSVPPP